MRRPLNLVNALRRARDAASSQYLKSGSPHELGYLYDLLVRAHEGDQAAQAEAERITRKLQRRAAVDGPPPRQHREKRHKPGRFLTVGPRRVKPQAAAVETAAEMPPREGEPADAGAKVIQLYPRSGGEKPVAAHVWRSKRSRWSRRSGLWGHEGRGW